MTASQFFTLFFLVLGLAQFAWYYPQLPDQVATHFNSEGLPDAWGDKGSFLFSLLLAYLVVVVAVLPWPWIINRVPHSLLNLPRKDYWLAPERSETTMANLKEQLHWFNVATVAFMGWVFNLILQANLKEKPTFDGDIFLWGLGAYLLFVTIWTVRILVHYRVPHES